MTYYTWEEVEEKYGVETANKMKRSQWLQGITVLARKKSDCRPATYEDYECGNIVFEYPEEDIERAYLDVTGQSQKITDWD